ncbi:alpha-L-rhamnosidase [Sporothrix schenckii 1099-18]|uniref:Alpha-L-rhamnosidase n=1 Tax=Sporothrix schenckii 1099-18 TaxID=1397361 RepID=A0A0F2MJM0_SPOSC|nr:alpha-L-rhamnosidase [Sporothrix schenckii 1099-18]KJR89903.1 alpha-L-rhamnosidase [Sporothrix schenckii 1099-18]
MDIFCSGTPAGLCDIRANTSRPTGYRNIAGSLLTRPWIGIIVLVAMTATATASPPVGQQFLDSNSTSWHKYVRAPGSKIIPPARILPQYTTGNVTNTDGLLQHGSGPTVLTRLGTDDGVPSFVIDFGINVAGQLSIDFAGAYNTTAGFPGISLAFSETLQYLSNRSDFTRSDNAGGNLKLTSGTDQVAVKPEPYSWTNQLGCEYGTQVCADGLHGFRYVKIRLTSLPTDSPYTSAYGSVSISAINLQYSGYLGTPDTFTGHFECSDPDITQWWYDAVYTNDLCTDSFLSNTTEPRNAASPSLLGKLVLLDGPKRDRDPYVGDLAVSALTTYLSHNTSEASLNVLEDLARHQRDDGWIPPASIVLVKVLDEYYVSNTNTATSLIERPGGTGDFAFLPRTGPVTYYNALYIHALQYAANVAQILNNSEDASRWQIRASAVGQALLKRNYDTSAGAFFDGGPCSNNTICPTHSQDGNSLAILSGVVPSGLSSDTSIAESILAYMNRTMYKPYGNAFYDNNILDPGGDYVNRVYAFTSYFEIAARFETSLKTSQGALEETRRLFGWMAGHDPTVTVWEGIGKDGTPYESGFTSMSHGWSTGIVPLLVNYVLGVSPAAPGFKKWRVKPVLPAMDNVSWASGLVPTPDGGIWVQWERRRGTFVLLVSAPDGTEGTVTIALSAGESSSVSVDGTVVYSQKDRKVGDNNGYVSISLQGGRHIIIVH